MSDTPADLSGLQDTPTHCFEMDDIPPEVKSAIGRATEHAGEFLVNYHGLIRNTVGASVLSRLLMAGIQEGRVPEEIGYSLPVGLRLPVEGPGWPSDAPENVHVTMELQGLAVIPVVMRLEVEISPCTCEEGKCYMDSHIQFGQPDPDDE